MESRTADQLEIMGALADVQADLDECARSTDKNLAWRHKLVESGRAQGLSVREMADHIGVKPSALGQAAYKKRLKAS